MPYSPENNPYIPGDPYSYDLKWIVKELKEKVHLNTDIQILTKLESDGQTITAPVPNNDIILKTFEISEPGIYMISGMARMSLTDYSTAEKDKIMFGLYIGQFRDESQINYFRNFNTGECKDGVNTVAIFDCKAGDTITMHGQQRINDTGITPHEEPVHFWYSFIRLR